MKKYLSIIITLACVLTAACSGTHKPADVTSEPPVTEKTTISPTEAPTAEPTVEPTAVSTAEPTAEPTAVSTAEPTAVPTERPVFPTPGPTGVLIDGPIFEEPAKYLVIDGESDLHYVYNNMGELVCSFNAQYEYKANYPACAGFYTEYGRPYGFDLRTMDFGKIYYCIGDIAYTDEYGYNDEIEEYDYVTEIRDRNLENPVFFKPGELQIGWLGGIMHVDGKYVVLKRTWHDLGYAFWKFDGSLEDKVYDENFELIGTIRNGTFGDIVGVYGGRYIIGVEYPEEDNPFERKFSIYSLDGKLLMKDVNPVFSSELKCNDELYYSTLSAADYLMDKDGRYFDSDLKQIPELPDDAGVNYMYSRYGRIELPNSEYVVNGVYAGVRDKEGNWLFKIYNPENANDHIP